MSSKSDQEIAAMDHSAKLKSAADAVTSFAKMLLGFDRPQLYRPEAHYMRGPGPKWRARYGEPKRVVVLNARRVKAR